MLNIQNLSGDILHLVMALKALFDVVQGMPAFKTYAECKDGRTMVLVKIVKCISLIFVRHHCLTEEL